MRNPSPFLAQLKARILAEAFHVRGFMRLLMKPRNGARWSAEDKALIHLHLKRLARTVPLLAIVSLPGGTLLLPLLAWFLDRRKKRRAWPPRPGRATEETAEP